MRVVINAHRLPMDNIVLGRSALGRVFTSDLHRYFEPFVDRHSILAGRIAQTLEDEPVLLSVPSLLLNGPLCPLEDTPIFAFGGAGYVGHLMRRGLTGCQYDTESRVVVLSQITGFCLANARAVAVGTLPAARETNEESAQFR
jgi:hypothetical protein